jgi:hypothetical protein
VCRAGRVPVGTALAERTAVDCLARACAPASEPAKGAHWTSFAARMRRVRGLGASSSSESAQPGRKPEHGPQEGAIAVAHAPARHVALVLLERALCRRRGGAGQGRGGGEEEWTRERDHIDRRRRRAREGLPAQEEETAAEDKVPVRA